MTKTLILSLLVLTAGLAKASNLQRIEVAFNQLDKDHMSIVDEVYAKEATFQDPVQEVKGVDSIRSYYIGLYKSVEFIRFEFKRTSEVDDFVTLEWRMHLKSDSINSGNEFTVDGVSLLTFDGPDGKIIAQRDYFDMGEFIYERIPVLNWFIAFIKSKLR
jgi:limonene-1,2-epoxide hydrolase